MSWVDCFGNHVEVSGEVTACDHVRLQRIQNTVDDRHLAAARSAIFLVAYHLVSLGYFLGLQKSILFPSKVVPYLGFFSGFF